MLKVAWLFIFIAWIKNLTPIGPIGFPSTIMFFRLAVYFKPCEIQNIDFCSMKLNDRSKYSNDLD